MSSNKIIELIEEERILERKSENPDFNSHAMKLMSKSCGLKYVSMIAPEFVRNPDVQNRRRLEAKDDIYNQISLVAVAAAILESPTVNIAPLN